MPRHIIIKTNSSKTKDKEKAFENRNYILSIRAKHNSNVADFSSNYHISRYFP